MGSSVANGAKALSTTAGLTQFLQVVKAHGIKELDTARVYNNGQSEELLGSVQASRQFAVSTKAPAFMPNSLAASKIVANCNASLKALKQDRMDIYYLHGPDRATPLEEQCKAINQLYEEGKFERWGVSNISDDEVQTIYDICKREEYVLPKVYQGGFNPIGRGAEKTLIPLLRKLGMAFYAFSPLGGGLLVKPLAELLKPTPGTRFDEMKVFGDIYLTPTIVAALKKVQKRCDEEGVSLMEATLRWFMHHSVLGSDDGVILGASSVTQIEASLLATERGALPKVLVEAWEEMYEDIKESLPAYHS